MRALRRRLDPFVYYVENVPVMTLLSVFSEPVNRRREDEIILQRLHEFEEYIISTNQDTSYLIDQYPDYVLLHPTWSIKYCRRHSLEYRGSGIPYSVLPTDLPPPPYPGDVEISADVINAEFTHAGNCITTYRITLTVWRMR
jgi:hypothetical protein